MARKRADPRRSKSKATRARATVNPLHLSLEPVLGSAGGELPRWFRPLDPGVKLAAGTPAPQLLRVPADAANRALATTVRLVANLPAGTSGDVVWTLGPAECLVHTASVKLACASGVVTFSVPVSCDQVPAGATVAVPFAVGTDHRTAGLVMSSFSRPVGPDVVTALWSEALIAFTWEALLQLAQRLCGAVGNDAAGRPLVPASIGAAPGVLILQAMARNELRARSAQGQS
jgi:hypothetical protein